MNFKQLILSMLIRVVITLIVFPFVPGIIHAFTEDPEMLSQFTETYTIIFTSGVITMIILDTAFIGSKHKYEWHFILFSLVFLAMIFYKNFESHLTITLVSLALSFIIFILRIPLRKIISKKNIFS